MKSSKARAPRLPSKAAQEDGARAARRRGRRSFVTFTDENFELQLLERITETYRDAAAEIRSGRPADWETIFDAAAWLKERMRPGSKISKSRHSKTVTELLRFLALRQAAINPNQPPSINTAVALAARLKVLVQHARKEFGV